MQKNGVAVHYLLLVLVTMMWGGGYIAGKYVASEIPPFTASLMRYILATLCLWLLLRKTEKNAVKLQRQHWLLFAFLGLTGVFMFTALFFLGLKYTTAVNASLIISTNPVMTIVIAALILREKVSGWQIFGIVTSFTGAVIVISGGSLEVLRNLSFNPGDLIVCGAPVAWAFYSVLGKKAMSIYSPLAATTYAAVFGTIILVPFALWEGVNWLAISPGSLLGIAYTAVFSSSISYTWWYRGVQAIGAGRTSIFSNLTPLWTMLLAAIILHESIVLFQLLGAGLIISGIYLTSIKKYVGSEVKDEATSQV